MAIGGQPTRGEGGHEGGNLAHQAVELQGLEPFGETVAIHWPQFKHGLLRQGDIHEDLGQLTGEIGVVAVMAELALERTLDRAAAGFGPFLLHFGQHPVHRIQVSVLLQEVDGGLGTDPLHTRDVVGAVTGQGLEVDDRSRCDAELGDDAFFLNQRRAAAPGIGTTTHVHHSDVAGVIHELKQVAVAAEDADTPACIGGSIGQGAKHVIRFKAGGETEGQLQLFPQNLLQLVEVLEEDLRRHISVRFVIGVCFVPKGWLRRVEGDGHPLRGEGFAVVEQGFEKAVGHARGDAVLGGKPPFASLAEGVEAAEGQRVAVHQQQQGFVVGGAHR